MKVPGAWRASVNVKFGFFLLPWVTSHVHMALMPLWQKANGAPERRSLVAHRPATMHVSLHPPWQSSDFGQIGPLIGFANVCPAPCREGTHFLCYSDSGLHLTSHQRVRVQAAHRGRPTVKILETVTASTLPSIAGRLFPPTTRRILRRPDLRVHHDLTHATSQPQTDHFLSLPVEGVMAQEFHQWRESLKPIKIDIVSDFSGRGVFAIHGEALLTHCLETSIVDFKCKCRQGTICREPHTDRRAPPAQMASSSCMLSTRWRHSSPS